MKLLFFLSYLSLAQNPIQQGTLGTNQPLVESVNSIQADQQRQVQMPDVPQQQQEPPGQRSQLGNDPNLNKGSESVDSFDLGRRDPFQLPSFIVDKLKVKATFTASSNKETIESDPLKRWSLEDYILVGVVWNVTAPKAMIVDKEGAMHVIRIRDRLGVLQATLVRIEEGRLIFNEKGNLKTLSLRK